MVQLMTFTKSDVEQNKDVQWKGKWDFSPTCWPFQVKYSSLFKNLICCKSWVNQFEFDKLIQAN